MVTKKNKPEYELYFLTVNDFSVSHHSGIDYKAIEAANTHNDQVPVYSHYPNIVFDCHCFYPETMDGVPFHVIIHGDDGNKDLKVSDFAEIDDTGRPKYAKRRGQSYPVHKLPTGIGSLEKVRGLNEWRSYCFVDTGAVATMIALLGIQKPFYLSIDVIKQQRYRAVRAVDLQTEKPE